MLALTLNWINTINQINTNLFHSRSLYTIDSIVVQTGWMVSVFECWMQIKHLLVCVARDQVTWRERFNWLFFIFHWDIISKSNGNSWDIIDSFETIKFTFFSIWIKLLHINSICLTDISIFKISGTKIWKLNLVKLK